MSPPARWTPIHLNTLKMLFTNNMADITGKFVSSLLRPDGLAYLDWISGLVRIDCRRDEWERLRSQLLARTTTQRDTLTEREVLLLETFTHEVTHYFQLCTTGYLYRLARDLLAVLYEVLPHDVDIIGHIPESEVARAAERLSAIKSERLSSSGPEGLDVVSIVESSAYMTQKLYHYPGLTREKYEDTLAGQPTIYSKGYEIARGYLGDETLGTYPVLASLALWTQSPGSSLIFLCETLAALAPKARGELQFGHLLDWLIERPGFIGPPWPRVGANFPEYELSVRRLLDNHVERENYMRRPFLDEHVRFLLEETMPLVLFNEDAEGQLALQYPRSWAGKTENEKAARGKMLTLLFTVSTHVQRIAPLR